MASVHHHEPINLDERYEFTSQARKRVFTALGIGILLLIIGIVLAATGITGGHDTHETHGAAALSHSATGQHGTDAYAKVPATQVHAPATHAAGANHSEFHWMQRVWANLWLNNVYFTGLAVIGVFFLAIQFVSWAGWSVLIQRVLESFGYFLPFAGALMLVTFIFGHHDLFHWTHSYLYDKASPDYDAIIAGKQIYLNLPFYIIRMVVFFALWITMFFLIRKASLREDVEGGTVQYNRMIKFSAVFLVIFAVSSSVASWDWVMSVDPHWFSTLFGWYMFASWFVSGLAAITLTVILLKEKGYLKAVNHNHLHDLGKFMFAFSIFWTYLWFAQFLLYYYANIPEEVIYFIERRDGFNHHYTGLFFFNIFINFAFPFLVLMTRDAKRHTIFLKIVACAILFGHWLDFYLMLMPGLLKENSGFGFIEFGFVLVYASLFIWVISNAISKAPLIAKNHPMLAESIHHDI